MKSANGLSSIALIILSITWLGWQFFAMAGILVVNEFFGVWLRGRREKGRITEGEYYVWRVLFFIAVTAAVYIPAFYILLHDD